MIRARGLLLAPADPRTKPAEGARNPPPRITLPCGAGQPPSRSIQPAGTMNSTPSALSSRQPAGTGGRTGAGLGAAGGASGRPVETNVVRATATMIIEPAADTAIRARF